MHLSKKKIAWLEPEATISVYTNYFYDTSVIFSNFIITYKEPFICPT